MHLIQRSLRSLLFAFFIIITGTSLLIAATKESDRGAKIYAESSKSVLMIIIKSAKGEIVGQGTGFVVAGGKIITNEHVVREGSVFVDLGAVKIPATIERVDAFNDIALLSVGVEFTLKPLTISDVSPKPGASVYALGNPQGLEKSISTGVVSAVREINGRQLLQITAPISQGSSGGPILNAVGAVVGVAVGILDRGQNLNFAVPAALVSKLLAGEVPSDTDVSALLIKVTELKKKLYSYNFSNEADSDWQKIDKQIDALLENALVRAGTDHAILLKIAEQAENRNNEIVITAADRAVKLKPTAEGNLILGKALTSKARVSDDNRAIFQDRAEKALRSAFKLMKQPTADMYYHLGDLLEDRENYRESESIFLRALELSKKDNNSDMQVDILRGLIRVERVLKKETDVKKFFAALVDMGSDTSFDWSENGRWLDGLFKYNEAGRSFQKAALLGGYWTNWCEAAGSYDSALEDNDDAVLLTSRKCISEGTGKKDSEARIADAHRMIAKILNKRGVYQEALSHARDATVLDSTNPWAFYYQAQALLGLRRFNESINASTQAIRLSDGKYATMHFNLGAAYFEVGNWEFARQSYEKAAQLNSTDSTAPYNVALCLGRLGYYRDAASWYEEVLRRNPSHPKKNDILSMIQLYRR